MTPAAAHSVTRRDALALLCGSALALACGRRAGPVEPAAIEYGRDECEFCRMTIDDAALAAQHVAAGNTVDRFGEVGCLLAWLAGDAAGERGGTSFVAVGGAWQRADSARYARGRTRTPMRFDITAVPRTDSDPAALAWAALLEEGTPRVHAT